MKSNAYLLNMVDNIYRKMYAKSTPSRDWDELKNSDESKQQKFFLNYIISENKYDEIIEQEFKRKRLTDYEKRVVKTTVCLGCSPKIEYQ